MATYSDVHGKAAKRILSFIENGKIIVKDVKGYEKHIQNSDLGEAQALELAKEINASYLISDDIECFWYLESNFKKTVFSVFIVRLLCNLNVLSDDDGWKNINKMSERRTWGMNIIHITAKKLWRK